MTDHRTEHWVNARIGAIFTTTGGGTPSTGQKAYWGEGIPWISSADIDESGEISPRRRVTRAGVAASATNPVPPRSVIVVTRVGLGKVGQATQELCFSQDCQALLFNPELIDPGFVAHQVRYVAKGVRGRGTTISGITVKQLHELPFSLPPFREQQRIVDAIESYLTRLDDAVASLERAQVKLKAYRSSILKAAVEGRLVPTEAALARNAKSEYEPADVLLNRILKEHRRRWEQAELARLRAAGKTPKDDKWKLKYEEPAAPDLTDAPPPPEGWCWASADQVGDILLGRQRSQSYLTGRWYRPYLRVANIKDDRIEFADIEQMDFDPAHYQKYRLKAGDILVSEGQSPHLVGQSAIYRGGLDDLCFQKTLHRFRPVSGGPTSEFAQVVFRANVRLGVYKRVAPITTNIAHLTLEKFKESRFPLPPKREQERIVSELERLLSVAEATLRQVKNEETRIRRLRQAILKWAFEGKLVDQDPNEESAEKLLARIRAERAAAVPRKAANGRARKGAA